VLIRCTLDALAKPHTNSCPTTLWLQLLWCRSLAAFDIRAKLYAGHISSVYRAVDRKSGITVGLKLYRRTMLNDMERHQIAREIWLHIQLNHPSIIALYAAWKDKDYIYLVLEWAPEVGCRLQGAGSCA
jgi:serine/threonine protein kinase